MNQSKLDVIVEKHGKWLRGEEGGERAALREADLRYANLERADLRGADLRGADLKYANLRRANLHGANLRRADLRGVDLKEADLKGANLRGANLGGADLSRANGFDVTFKKPLQCQFFIGASKKWDIITIGCKTHTTLEWQSYLEAEEWIYLEECGSEEAHNRCLDVIKSMIEHIETGKLGIGGADD